MNGGIYKTVYGPEMKRSDTYEYDQWRCLNRENIEHFLRSQLLNAKVVQELYNSEGRKNVKIYIFILDSKGHTEYDIKEKIKEFIKSPTTKRVAIFVFSCLVNYTICPGISTVIKFVLPNGDEVEASTHFFFLRNCTILVQLSHSTVDYARNVQHFPYSSIAIGRIHMYQIFSFPDRTQYSCIYHRSYRFL
jgi:hypothetical protein